MSDNRTLKIIADCAVCDKQKILMVDPQDFDQWNNGKLIQNAFPYLSAADRELIISGTCGECFDKIFFINR